MKLKTELLSSNNIGLAWSFHVSPDSCENPEYYENYIRLSAGGDYRTGVSVTHMFIDEKTGKLAGYVALRTTSLVSEGENGNKIVHPAFEIAELAVSGDYERSGVGSEMFCFAILMADKLRRETAAIKYIAVCSDPRSTGFYEKLGFAPVKDLYDVPRDGWNDNCVPMFIELPDL